MQVTRGARGGPAVKHLPSGGEDLLGAVLSEQRAPVVRGLQGLVAVAVVGGQLGPIDREVRSVNLGERLGGVVQPSGHSPIPRMGGDDRLDVPVQNRQALGVPVQREAGVATWCGPAVAFGWLRSQLVAKPLELVE